MSLKIELLSSMTGTHFVSSCETFPKPDTLVIKEKSFDICFGLV